MKMLLINLAGLIIALSICMGMTGCVVEPVEDEGIKLVRTEYTTVTDSCKYAFKGTFLSAEVQKIVLQDDTSYVLRFNVKYPKVENGFIDLTGNCGSDSSLVLMKVIILSAI